MELIVFAVVVFVYFVPTVVAVQRGHNPSPVLLTNLFFGWTVVGWIIALIMALGSDSETIHHIVVIHHKVESEESEKEKSK